MYQSGDPRGQNSLPDPLPIIPRFEPEVVDKAIAISSSKSLQDRSDLSVSVSVPKKIYTKDLL